MRIGYARVSTQEQDTQAQIAALKESGCERIFQEKAVDGTGQSCIVCWSICARGMCSLYGN